MKNELKRNFIKWVVVPRIEEILKEVKTGLKIEYIESEIEEKGNIIEITTSRKIVDIVDGKIGHKFEEVSEFVTSVDLNTNKIITKYESHVSFGYILNFGDTLHMGNDAKTITGTGEILKQESYLALLKENKLLEADVA